MFSKKRQLFLKQTVIAKNGQFFLNFQKIHLTGKYTSPVFWGQDPCVNSSWKFNHALTLSTHFIGVEPTIFMTPAAMETGGISNPSWEGLERGDNQCCYSYACCEILCLYNGLLKVNVCGAIIHPVPCFWKWSAHKKDPPEQKVGSRQANFVGGLILCCYTPRVRICSASAHKKGPAGKKENVPASQERAFSFWKLYSAGLGLFAVLRKESAS